MRAGVHQSDLFSEFCSVLFSILHSPHLALLSSPPFPPPPAVAGRRRPPISPAAFATLLLGASLALMLCGSVTFVIGFILMPWVLGIVMFFYFVGFLSNLSGIWIGLLCPIRKEVQGQLFSNLPINLEL